MTRHEDIHPTEAIQEHLSHINDPTSPHKAGEATRGSAKSGLQRMQGLIKAVHDLSNQANNTVLYPTLAFHLLPTSVREKGLSLLEQSTSSNPPWSKDVEWVRNETQKGVLARARHKREVAVDPTGNKKAVELLSEMFREVSTPPINVADLKELPQAATELGFNTTFSLLESFFMLHLRLEPLFVKVQGAKGRRKGNKDVKTCLNIVRLSGRKGDVDQQIRVGLARVMEELGEAAGPLKSLIVPLIQHPSTTVEVSPATRFLGALTWDVWEENDLASFINQLHVHRTKEMEAHRLRGAASNPQRHIPRRYSAVEQARSRKGLTWVEWGRSFHPLSAIDEEIAYCTWLLESMTQEGLVAAIVPSLEGVGFSCSKKALYAFWELLRKELSHRNGSGGANSLWTKDCENSQGRIVTGSWLLSLWGHSLDPGALSELSQPLTPQQGLDSFRRAVEKSNNGFCESLQGAIERFVEDLIFSQCTLHPSIDNLVEQIAALGAGANQPIALGATVEGGLDDSLHQSQAMLTNERSTLHNRLRRLGVDAASISAAQDSDTVFSSLTDKISYGGLANVTPEAVSTARCLKELHTFWISETGTISNLNPTRSSKGGGTWKKQFSNYISKGSAGIVRWALEEFCLSRGQM